MALPPPQGDNPPENATTEEQSGVLVRSIFGYRTRQPLVEVEVPRPDVRREDRAIYSFTPDHARQLGLGLLRAAEAAEQDQVMMTVMLGYGGMSEEEAARFLHLLRETRLALEEGRPPPMPARPEADAIPPDTEAPL